MESQSVAALTDEIWKFRLEFRPELAISKGLIPSKPQLDSFSLENYEKRLKYVTSLLERVHSVDTNNLDESDLVSIQMLKYYLEMVISGDKYKPYLQPFNARNGSDLLFLRYTVPKLPFNTLQDYEYYLGLLELQETQTYEMITLMQEGLNKGIVRTKHVLVPNVVNRLEAFLSANPEDTAYFKPLLNLPNDIPQENRKYILEKTRLTIQNKLKPAFQNVLEFLKQKYIPNAPSELSIDGSPGSPPGRYQTMLKFYCDTDLSPQQVHEIGKREVKKTTDLITGVLSKAGFEGSMQDFRSHLDGRQEQWCSTEDELIQYCHDILEKRIAEKLPHFFSHIITQPLDMTFDVKSGTSTTKAYYLNASATNARIVLDGSSLHTLPKYDIPVLMAHEANPGHHFQAAYSLDQPNIPAFRKYKDERIFFENPANFPQNTAYTEGWGLYSELLAHEMGVFQTVEEEFGYLISDLARCGRVVADTGLHAMGWSLQQAATYLTQHTCMTQTTADNEVRRYLMLPAHGCSYKIGQLRILELREKCITELGDMFDIKEFHDVCLSCGQVPLDILEQIVGRFIARKKSS